MVDYDNRDYITTLSASNSDLAKGIVDGDDHIHSGIIKALELAAKGTYVVEYGSSVFQQVAGSSRTQFQFSGDIRFVREGRAYVATPAAEELKSDPDGTNDRYDMLVINNSNALEIREGTAATTPRVPDVLTSGDIPVALIRVAGGSGANDTNREIQLYGYNRGVLATSLAKVYNNAGSEIIDITGTDVSLWTSTAVGAFTLERSEAGKEILTVKNTGGAKGAVIEGTGGTNTQPVLDVKYGGASMTSVSGQGNMTVANDVTLTAGNLQVGGNIIKASDGGSTITMDTDDNVTIAGDLTVAGGDILGPTDGALTIKADTDMIFRIDSDNDGAETFQFQTNNGNEVMSLDEAGNLQIDGDLNISGGNLVTTAVTANLQFTAAAGLVSAADHYIVNNGGKYESFIHAAGLIAADSPTGADLGLVTHVIEPVLITATANPISFRNEVVYLGTSVKNQVVGQEIKESGATSHANYDLLVEGINAPSPINGLIGGGGFVCLDSPDTASVNQKKITLVNTSNVPCYILTASSASSPVYGYAGFHKGLKTRDYLRTDISQNTVNLSRCLETSTFNNYNLEPNINIGTLGENAYLLKAGCSVTLHAIQLTQESNPAYQVQDNQGFYPQDPRAYWMVRNSAEGTITSKIAYNTTMASVVLGPAQSGYSIYANYSAGAQFIILPPTPAFGTQYFIYAMNDVTVICRNATNGTTNAGGTTATDVIRDSGADVNTKAMGSGTMATFIYGPDNKWLLVG